MATRKPRRPRPQKAVIDRVEDGTWAVLLVGREELEKIVHVDRLPQGARAGSWLKVRLEEDKVSDIAVDEAETRAARRRVGSKLERLRQRGAHFKPVAASAVQDDTNTLHNPTPRPLPARRENPADAPKLLRGPVEDAAAFERADDIEDNAPSPAETDPRNDPDSVPDSVPDNDAADAAA